MVGADTNIRVRKNQQVVLRRAGQSAELADLVIGTEFFPRHDQANRQSGEVRDDFANHWGGRVPLRTDREQDFVFRIILTAVTGKVFVSLGIQPVNRFQDAHRRTELAGSSVLAPEEAARGKDDKYVG